MINKKEYMGEKLKLAKVQLDNSTCNNYDQLPKNWSNA